MSKGPSGNIILTGELIRTFERERVVTAIVVLDPCRIDIAADLPQDVHLGDKVRCTGRLVIDKVSLLLPQADGNVEI